MLTNSVFEGFDRPPAKNIPPWRGSCFRLLSWWEMEKFSARNFYLIGNLLGILPAQIEKALNPDCAQPSSDEKVSLETRNHVAVWVMEIQKHCEEIGLEYAVVHTKRFIWRLERDMTLGDMRHQITELKDRIYDSMANVLFMHVPKSEAEFYEPVDAFGPDVSSAFPSIWYDVREAYTCYALDRPTASVFHLMRVLEVALVALGRVFGFSFSHTNWGPAIDQLESKIREMGNDPAWKSRPDWKEQQEFYSQAVGYLHVTKDAWRNYTAHARGKFEPKQVKVMLENVKLFMQHISHVVGDRAVP